VPKTEELIPVGTEEEARELLDADQLEKGEQMKEESADLYDAYSEEEDGGEQYTFVASVDAGDESSAQNGDSKLAFKPRRSGDKKRRRKRSSASRVKPTGVQQRLCDFLKNPELKKRKRTAIAAVLFFLVGVVFLIVGVVSIEVLGDTGRGMMFIIIGALVVLPGSYACYVLYRALRDQTGSAFSQLPSYD